VPSSIAWWRANGFVDPPLRTARPKYALMGKDPDKARIFIKKCLYRLQGNRFKLFIR
jgi:hypothetical protein